MLSFTSIDGRLLRKMMIAGANNLSKNQQMVDELNVFPVPDGDTGTNMSLTVLSAAREVYKTSFGAGVEEVAKAASSGSLRGARGNSGVILSQLFRGFAKGLAGVEYIDSYDLARACRQAVQTAYKAVMKPKEGTVLTVAKGIADKVSELADETEDLEQIIKEALLYGNEVLDKTPEMLPVLKQAGVVDAGGKGLLCLLEGAFAGREFSDDIMVNELGKENKVDFSALASVEQESITFGYCTEFFINVQNASDKTVDDLKNYLNTIGDSIVVVNDEEIIKVHVHSDHPGSVIEKALTIGSLTNLKIDNMRYQHSSKIDFGGAKTEKPVKKEMPRKKNAFVAIAMGKGIAEIFEQMGVDYVIEGGQTMNPSTEDILKAVESLNAENVFVLPNNKNIILAAEQASKLEKDKNVVVIPTKTIPQGISAMISYDESKEVAELEKMMKDVLSTVKTGQLTFAVRDTMIKDIAIKQGDILGMMENDIEVVGKELNQTTKELLDKLIDEDSEIVTIYYGQETDEENAQKMAEYVEEKYPDCEVEVHNGGQPLYYFIISVE